MGACAKKQNRITKARFTESDAGLKAKSLLNSHFHPDFRWMGTTNYAMEEILQENVIFLNDKKNNLKNIATHDKGDHIFRKVDTIRRLSVSSECLAGVGFVRIDSAIFDLIEHN